MLVPFVLSYSACIYPCLHLQKTQFGFRKKRGTADAIQCVRRIIDKGESTNTKTLLVLLDWAKAFDKVTHAGLFVALECMNVETKIVNLVKAVYSNPQFCVEIDGIACQWRRQETGIRQGCPLSPYLFIIIMTVLFHDIHAGDGATPRRHRVQGAEFDEVLYADDTICISENEKAINEML